MNYKHLISLLKKGAIGLLPSDTIYGLSCSVLNKTEVERIYELKGRDYDKPLIILLTGIEQAKELGLDPKELEPVRKYWPASLSVVAPAGADTPEFLHRGTKTLAVRIPNIPALRELMRKVGPLVSTSANVQGERPGNNVAEAKKVFGDKLDFYVDGGQSSGQPSTLAEVKGGQLKVLRQGSFRLV